MPSKAVADAVEARLASNWSRCPIIGVNLGGSPPADGSSFLTVQYPVANSDRITLGPRFREEGAFRLVLSIERGQGVSGGLAWADELSAIFRGKKFEGVETQAPSPPFIDDSNEAGNYFRLSIIVPYFFDVIGTS